jgi:cytochrome c oxidase subunit I
VLASHLSPAVLCLIGSFFLCLLSVLSRLRPTQNAIDIAIGNTYYPIAHFHVAVGFALVFIVFAGVYSGFPQLLGRSLNDRLGQVHFILTMAGACALLLILQITSILSYGVTMVLWLACAVIVVAQFLFGYNLLWSLFKRRDYAGP